MAKTAAIGTAVTFYKGFIISTRHVRPESYAWLQAHSQFYSPGRYKSEEAPDTHHFQLSVSARYMPSCPEEVCRILDFGVLHECELVDIVYCGPLVKEFGIFPR